MNLNNLTRRQTLKGLSIMSLGAALPANANSTPPKAKDCRLEPWIDKVPETEVYGPCNGLTRFLVADKKSIRKNTTLIAKVPKGADFGGHYHEDYEIIYVLDGCINVEIKEWDSPLNPELGTHRTFSFQKDLDSPIETPTITSENKIYTIQADGWVNIPGFAFHSTYPQCDSRVIAYLPDAERLDEEPPTPYPGCVS